jgi:hypothetical protein
MMHGLLLARSVHYDPPPAAAAMPTGDSQVTLD